MTITLRKAKHSDIAAIQALIERSARGLSVNDYRASQVEGALRGAFGVDTQLLRDETYFVALDAAALAGCGGWSFRSTLFGGDARVDRDANELDPMTEAARIRAFFVDPAFARRGVASLLLERCENEARLRGFSQAALMATLPGMRFYAARGYVDGPKVHHDLGGGESIEFVPMHKRL